VLTGHTREGQVRIESPTCAQVANDWQFYRGGPRVISSLGTRSRDTRAASDYPPLAARMESQLNDELLEKHEEWVTVTQQSRLDETHPSFDRTGAKQSFVSDRNTMCCRKDSDQFQPAWRCNDSSTDGRRKGWPQRDLHRN
jgi:hypothetical protein